MDPFPHRVPDRIRKRTGSTDRDGHGTDPIVEFFVDDDLRDRAAGEHLHRRAGRDDFSRAARLGDEEEDLQEFPAPGHGEDLVHPRPHPFQLFRSSHRPDEHDFPRRDGALVIPLQQIADVRDLVRDANATGEKDDGAVAV